MVRQMIKDAIIIQITWKDVDNIPQNISNTLKNKEKAGMPFWLRRQILKSASYRRENWNKNKKFLVKPNLFSYQRDFETVENLKQLWK